MGKNSSMGRPASKGRRKVRRLNFLHGLLFTAICFSVVEILFPLIWGEPLDMVRWYYKGPVWLIAGQIYVLALNYFNGYYSGRKKGE